ncbi:MAG: hypothetical protein K2K59_01805, partial [Muribaculaceae bacterium]|nr:hypothetical protein [Muribaculaceae bacterium]
YKIHMERRIPIRRHHLEIQNTKYKVQNKLWKGGFRSAAPSLRIQSTKIQNTRVISKKQLLITNYSLLIKKRF